MIGPYPHEELADASVAQLRQRLESGEVTSEQLVSMYADRIRALDRDGPGLRAILELNPEVEAIARRADAERRRGRVRGPLHGIPVVVKDNIDTGDRMMTTAGSMALVGPPAESDAPLVTRLRRSGLVLLGKTNLSEWANFRSFRSSSGWSGRGRQTLNPYVLDRSPSGSSSGSAVAVSAGLAPLAVGTETDGSIISPSAVNGIVGFKPAVGRVSSVGVVPISSSQDTAGPHAQHVADAAALYACLAGLEPATMKLSAKALKGRRIGALRQHFVGYSEHVDRVYEDALLAIRDAGAIVVDPVEAPGAAELHSSRADLELVVLLHEFKACLNAYLRSRRGIATRSLRQLIAFNTKHAADEMPYFQQEIFEKAEATTGLRAKRYRDALANAQRLARQDGIDGALRKYRLHALVAPSGEPAWTIDPINGDKFLGGSSQLAAVAGYPSITVPAGRALSQLPVAISLFSSPARASELLAMAFAFEQATKSRFAPKFQPALSAP